MSKLNLISETKITDLMDISSKTMSSRELAKLLQIEHHIILEAILNNIKLIKKISPNYNLNNSITMVKGDAIINCPQFMFILACSCDNNENLIKLITESMKLEKPRIPWEDILKEIAEEPKIERHYKTYIIEFNDKVKIGKAVNPEKRIKKIEYMVGEDVKRMYIIDKNIELKLHHKFDKYRIKGEYFKISFDDIINQIHQELDLLLS